MQFILVDMIIIYHLGKISKTSRGAGGAYFFWGGDVDHIHKITCNLFWLT